MAKPGQEKVLGMKEARPGIYNWQNFIVIVIVLKGKHKNDTECLWNRWGSQMKHKSIFMY